MHTAEDTLPLDSTSFEAADGVRPSICKLKNRGQKTCIEAANSEAAWWDGLRYSIQSALGTYRA